MIAVACLSVVVIVQLGLIVQLLGRWERERTRLLNAALSNTPQEYVALQAVSEPRKPRARRKSEDGSPPARQPKALGL